MSLQNHKPTICLLIGPAGAGKTTVSKLLAARFEKSAVVEVDELRHMIQAGKTSPFIPEGREQLRLSTLNAAVLAQNFADRGFHVIIDDCVAGKSRLDLYFELLNGYRLTVVLLLPRRDVVQKRDGQRTGTAQMGQRALELHERLTRRAEEETRWHVIDNSDQTPAETTEALMTLLLNQTL